MPNASDRTSLLKSENGTWSSVTLLTEGTQEWQESLQRNERLPPLSLTSDKGRMRTSNQSSMRANRKPAESKYFYMDNYLITLKSSCFVDSWDF